MRARTLMLTWLNLATAAFASAGQLDPLLFLKDRPAPNVVLAVETTVRMQMDGAGAYRDPQVYSRTGADWELALGVTARRVTASYRRMYLDLRGAPGGSYLAASIAVVGDTEPGYAAFDASTRLHAARVALARVVRDNRLVGRFGLVQTRHLDARLDLPPAVAVMSEDASQQAPSETGPAGVWLAAVARGTQPNGTLAAGLPLVRAEGGGANDAVSSILAAEPGQPGALLPAGIDPPGGSDAPLGHLLEDARSEAARLIALDGAAVACRNTVVVMLVGGGDGQTAPAVDLAARAASFLDVGGHRVPVYVIALAPRAEDQAALGSIAAASGGQYFAVSASELQEPDADGLVPSLARAITCAVQHAFASSDDVNARPGPTRPYGTATSYEMTGPVVATVDLRGASSAAGAPLPGTSLTSPSSQAIIPQRSNVVITAGFNLPGAVGSPGFPGRASAFRIYRPEADASRPSGYRFVADGTRLWSSSVPAPEARNIYTATPDGRMVAFTTSNAGLLGPWLRSDHPARLIEEVRAWPLGAILDSTPAVLDPPSLDPPPDPEYRVFAEAAARRRALVFVGANDGMLHALDARLGTEVWAFIPFNLLPRLAAIARGQSVGAFKFGVDASPRLADVRTAKGWRTWLVIGEGAGGTFYQALDVTLPDVVSAVAPDTDNIASLLGYFARPDRIPLAWSFPDYRHFDPSRGPYGGLADDATEEERTVGETWSVPAVVELLAVPGRHVVLMGSGFYSPDREREPGRFPSSSRQVGTTLYMLDAETGRLLASRDVGSDGDGEDIEDCSASGDCSDLKNALQADVVAVHAPGSRRVSAAYAADLDGRLWRFTLGGAGGEPTLGSAERLYDGGQPIFSLAGVDSGRASFLFFGTGSDRLPSRGGSATASTLVGVVDTASGGAGLRFSLPADAASGAEAGRIAGPPVIAGDVVFFAVSDGTLSISCAKAGSSLYAVTFNGGAAYDTNGDGRVDESDRRQVVSWSARRLTAARAADRHLLVGTSAGIELFGDDRGFNTGAIQPRPRVLSWRVIGK